MKADEARLLELNEAGWWEKWAEFHWIGKDCYLLFSRDFRETFFNRAGFVEVGADVERLVDLVEAEFAKRRTPPSLWVPEARVWGPLREILRRRGYEVLDSVSVMKGGEAALVQNPQVEIEVGTRSLDDWVRVYLESFYGGQRLLTAVKKIVNRASADEDVTLLVASIDGRPVGCASAYRTKGILGAYCVGTVPTERRSGVGKTMLGKLGELASKERRALVLQTMLSDSVEVFYLKNGFERVYLKTVFGKKPDHPRGR